MLLQSCRVFFLFSLFFFFLSGGKGFKLLLRISHLLSWLIFQCRLLHPSSSEIQLWCCAVRVDACGPIHATALGGKSGEKCQEDGGEGQQQQIRTEGIKRKRQKSLEKAENQN